MKYFQDEVSKVKECKMPKPKTIEDDIAIILIAAARLATEHGLDLEMVGIRAVNKIRRLEYEKTKTS